MQCIYDIFAGDFNVCFIGSNSIVSLSISQAHLNFKKCFFSAVCEKPSTPEHGSYELVFGSDRFPVGTKIEYKCDKGYSIKKGTAEATCQQRGNHIDWYPHDARHCEGELVALQEAQ